jgi:hypothetical protein
MRPWRAPRNDPVMVTYGYAVTIDAAQSLTVVSDAAERGQIVKRQI